MDTVTFSYNTLSTSQNQIAGLKLYPNPVKEVLHIESNNTSEKSIELFNVLGKSVYKGKTINNSVNLSNVNKGVYVVKITEEEKTVTRKIVIN
ncbi:Por secretion system C-terminal sorting domain-containing protein [Flavobacterium terrae]|uniref:Por secretion system C-terminal sorting domain-containing protein n=1 Tax=Flavobacterium terrae TaxID=415425 RepID=A0A1M6BC02_9FLAO|nr:Por secretion system C-terminal sorting domain-containing protein [Flavobacterium terrae]